METFKLTAEQWAAFMAELDGMPKPKPRLERLLSEPSVIEREFLTAPIRPKQKAHGIEVLRRAGLPVVLVGPEEQ